MLISSQATLSETAKHDAWITLAPMATSHSVKAGLVLDEHAHADMWQGDWILSGDIRYDLPQMQLHATAGYVVFIPPQTPHRLFSPSGYSFRTIRFSIPKDLVEHRVIKLRIQSDAPLLALLAEEVFVPRFAVPWQMTCRYLGSLLRLMAPPTASELQSETTNDPIVQAKQYILTHLGTRLTLEDLADRVGLSASQLAREFRKAYDLPPGKWISVQRLNRAATLLQRADLSISQIAAATGYADLPTFSKAFKRRWGLSPLAYRRKFGEFEGLTRS